MTDQPILIAGGGIGGLTAALSLARRQYSVAVFEQDSSVTEFGAGIQVSPNAARVLHDLGLDTALLAVATLPERIEIRHWRSGRLIASQPLGEAAVSSYRYPYCQIHRADLRSILLDAVAASPAITLHGNQTVTSFQNEADAVLLRTTEGEFSGAVLVGADGVHSTVRQGLFGFAEPTFTGNVAWRALVPSQTVGGSAAVPSRPPVTTLWWGPGKHFVHYGVCGGRLVNCVCVVEKAGWEKESWTERGDHGELKADFRGWHPDIQALIEGMDKERCFKWALYDRPPMARWGEGPVTLLGDACHPMLPFLAQGAAMAMEDAAVLAACVAAAGPDATSLRRYEELRQARTARLQAASRRNARVFHMSGPGAWVRNRLARFLGSRILDDVYRYDALTAASPTMALASART